MEHRSSLNFTDSINLQVFIYCAYTRHCIIIHTSLYRHTSDWSSCCLRYQYSIFSCLSVGVHFVNIWSSLHVSDGSSINTSSEPSNFFFFPPFFQLQHRIWCFFNMEIVSHFAFLMDYSRTFDDWLVNYFRILANSLELLPTLQIIAALYANYSQTTNEFYSRINFWWIPWTVS